MNRSGKIIAIIALAGLITLVAGINLLYTTYDLAGIICTVLGILILVPACIVTLITNLVKKHKEPKVRYGRYDKGTEK